MDWTVLISSLAAIILKYGKEAAQGLIDLIHGNPQQQGETDEAYIARINPLIDAHLASADKKADEVIADQTQ